MTHLQGSFSGIGVGPQVESALGLSRVRVRVFFTEPMTDDAALNAAGSYTITEDVGSDPRFVLEVWPENVTNPGYVDLVLDGQVTEGVDNYNVQVSTTLTDVAGNALDASSDDANFGFESAVEAGPGVEDPIVHIGLLNPERYYSGLGAGSWGAAGASDEPAQYLESPTNHERRTLRRLIAQYQGKPNMLALIRALVAPWQELEDILYLITEKRDVDNGFGVLLDDIGGLVGLARGGLEDNTYRTRLAGRIVANASKSVPEDVRATVDMLMQGLAAVHLDESPPGVMILRTEQLIQEDGDVFAAIAQRAMPIATRILLHWELPIEMGESFGFEDDNGAGPWAEFAEDPSGAGLWAEGSDGG